MTHIRCKARQYSDQMNCHDCGLVWDMNDPDPPTCGYHGTTSVIPTPRNDVPNSYRAAKEGE